MLNRVMKECRNYFVRTIERGDFVISGGIITIKGTYLIGQHIRVMGSVLNDGVYKVADNLITLIGAQDEAFRGAVCGLAAPPDFLDLVKVIEGFEAKKGTPSALTSESFGGYAYSLATNANGVPLTWQNVFLEALTPYRRMFEEQI